MMSNKILGFKTDKEWQVYRACDGLLYTIINSNTSPTPEESDIDWNDYSFKVFANKKLIGMIREYGVQTLSKKYKFQNIRHCRSEKNAEYHIGLCLSEYNSVEEVIKKIKETYKGVIITYE